MRIEKLRTNHLTDPLGFQMDKPVFSWVVAESSGVRQRTARVRVASDAGMTDTLFDSGERADISSLAVPVDLPLKPRTRYYWQVAVTADDGDSGVSGVAWFETAKRDEPWQGSWIRAPFEGFPVFSKRFEADRPVKRARLYICGLGLYEAGLNGKRIGDEVLAPGYDSYQYQIQYQTYDVTDGLRAGENALSVMLGPGWYAGRYGFGRFTDKLYGDHLRLLAELRLEYADGTETVVATDDTWRCGVAPVTDGNLYDGETYDARLEGAEPAFDAICDEAPEGRLIERIGLPVKVLKTFADYELIHTPAGEWVLDFGQNMAGWATFTCDVPAGEKVRLQYGELLQNGCFYRENLRSALAEYTCISGGRPVIARPRFTYYGFRFVKVEGMTEAQIRAAGFQAEAIWSALDDTGTLRTSDGRINRLIENALWSQRGNFVDIPTDCPQRDERMGWTGDAQVFSETASYNMYTPAFYGKFLSDMLLEQRHRGGSVPFVVPDALKVRLDKYGVQEGDFGVVDGSCAWGDAATVIPWNLYCYYGDPTLLEKQYENMKRWVDFIRREDESKCGGSHIWSSGFHFADWLALDNPDANSPLGGTDSACVATCYYYLSATLVARAARALGRADDADAYAALADAIREAFRREYLKSDGTLAIPTQTAHVLALNLELLPAEQTKTVAEGLRALLRAKGDHLDTGFVGTYQLCPTLSKCGMTDVAYTLLFNEDFPGWLYEVNLGATTIWERWNSVLPDGSVSDTGMNSMNHYAYGSIVQWIYQTVTGLRPDDAAPGFKRAVIAPEPDARLDWAACAYDSASGRYEARWERREGRTVYTVAVPFDAEARFVAPKGSRIVRVNGKPTQAAELTLTRGIWTIEAAGSFERRIEEEERG